MIAKRRMPHIQVDAYPLVDDHFSGIGHYTLGITRGLDELAGEGKLSYSLISPKRRVDRLKKYKLEHFKRVIPNPLSMRTMQDCMRYHLPIPFDFILGKGHYYFPFFLAWPTWISQSTVVIYDVTYLAVAECAEKENRNYLADVMPFSLKNAKTIITISEFSKAEIVKYYGIAEHRIVVAYPSIDRTHFYRRSPEEITRIKAKYDIFSEKYIFSVGNIEPRKNYVRLIEAYTSLPKKITDAYPLVIVGAGGWNNAEIKEKMQKAKEAGYRILNPKVHVPDEDMPALYSGAIFFVFPSIYEGFGMPPLEAYACGTPVIASNITSIPEAAGKAAMYIDPYSVTDIKEKLEEMIHKVEQNPQQFDEAMKLHLAPLSWRKSAEITAAALTNLPIEYFHKDIL
jgi:glycosyltransferase involved in cell wall biosynthesis